MNAPPLHLVMRLNEGALTCHVFCCGYDETFCCGGSRAVALISRNDVWRGACSGCLRLSKRSQMYADTSLHIHDGRALTSYAPGVVAT